MISEAGALPPPAQVAQEGRFPGAGHALDQEYVGVAEDGVLDGLDVEVAADEPVLGVGLVADLGGPLVDLRLLGVSAPDRM